MENTLFPGRPNYTGPTVGWFALLHHDELCEESHDVMERVAYVVENKPKNEVETRLHNMIYLGKMGADYEAKRAPLWADYKAKRAPLRADYEAKRAPLWADYKAKRAPLRADYKAKDAALWANYKAKDAALWANYKAKDAALWADYEAKRAPLRADYEAKRAPLRAAILAFIRKHIPDCAWNETKFEMQFPA